MKIAIIGYGKMGHEVELSALARGHEVELIIDQNNAADLNQKNLANIEMAIEFSTPESAPGNILTCLRARVPIVSGTTGWLNQMAKIKDVCSTQKGALFYASNFSLGIYVFSRVNIQLAKMMNSLDTYRVEMEEIHHVQKKDQPSGTAVSLAEEIIEHVNRLASWTNDPPKVKQKDTLPIHSIRTGNVPGTHSILWDSEFDQIKLIHTAKNRKGLALGTILAAEFLRGKSGFFEMKDMLKF